MANNRMYLKFNPTGQKILIAKRMGGSWYGAFSNSHLGDVLDLDTFLEECWQGHCGITCGEEGKESHQDDFSIELEIPVSENTPLKI